VRTFQVAAGVAGVPSSVSIPQGTGSVYFAVTGEQVERIVSAVITA
jgi:hypothetical protein